MRITDDLPQLLRVLPYPVQERLTSHPQLHELIEVVLDLGRFPEARFPRLSESLSEEPVTHEHLRQCIQQVGYFGGDNRAGIEETLHRISAIRNRSGEIIGLTCRVGRAVYGTISLIRDLVETGRSILMLGRPGVGKTTALREIARVLADDLNKRVIIIDTSNEIAGDGDIPHPAIGRSRRMQVSRPELQHQVMIEAVENHMPEVIIIDEIGTELEALAARTIAERGVQLIGTAHGNQVENLIKNPTLADLVGGIQSVTLGDDEARRRGTQKTVLERKAPPTFEIAVEMGERQRWTIHEQVAETVDNLLRDRRPNPQIRTFTEDGQVSITHALPPLLPNPSPSHTSPWKGGWSHNPLAELPPHFNHQRSRRRNSGSMNPAPFSASTQKRAWRVETPRLEYQEITPDHPFTESSQTLLSVESLNSSGTTPFGIESVSWHSPHPPSNVHDSWDVPQAEDLGNPEQHVQVSVYPYGVSRQQLEQLIQTLQLPVVITKDITSADVILALHSHVKHHSKLRQMAKARQVPVHVVKDNSIPRIARALKRILKPDDPLAFDELSLELLYGNTSDEEIEALEETRLAVEQVVIPKGLPVELLPRSPKVRKMQHELVEHYRLQSRSLGEEPNRRLRIYPSSS